MPIIRYSGRNWLSGTIGCGIAAILLSAVFCSCGTTRPYVYMQGSFDTAKYSQLPPFDPDIKKGDLLTIVVFSANPGASAFYNQAGNISAGDLTPGGGGGSTSSQTPASTGSGTPTYLVDEKGNITFRDLGVLHVEGMTRGQLTDTLNNRLSEYLTNPYCNVRFLNYKFSMLGEVERPGVITTPGEQLSVLEALSMAGGMTIYGRRDNVLVIREKDGKRTFARLDLTRPDVMSSPYFYLQQNDLVYVEQNKKKSVATDQSTLRTVTIATTVITLVAVLISLFKK